MKKVIYISYSNKSWKNYIKKSFSKSFLNELYYKLVIQRLKKEKLRLILDFKLIQL